MQEIGMNELETINGGNWMDTVSNIAGDAYHGIKDDDVGSVVGGAVGSVVGGAVGSVIGGALGGALGELHNYW